MIKTQNKTANKKVKKSDPKVSVIIPVYNVEPYLRQCLDSVVNQTLKDIEIICVDDGSTDNSDKVLDEYAAKDKRIKVIHKKNEGVSAARNTGIEEAKGQYLIFVDGDDFIEAELAEKAYKQITKSKADVLIFGTYEVNPDNNQNKRWDLPLLTDFYNKKFNVSDLEMFMHLLHSLWDKMYRTAFIKDNQILFPSGIKIAEDNIFVLETYLKKAKYAFLPECFYNYRTGRQGSATTNSKECVINQIKAFKYLENCPFYQNQTPETKRIIINQFLDGCIWLINQSAQIRKCSYLMQVKKFVKYLEKKYSKTEIKQMPNYRRLRHFFKKDNSFWENIFSVKNTEDKRHKILTVLFIKFKFLRKKYAVRARADKNTVTGTENIFKYAGKNSVLIFEAQPHHGECLPAYIKYFNDLGYHVDLLVLKEIINQDPFSLLPPDSDFNLIEGSWNNREDILKNPAILKYKHLLISTAICYYEPQVPVIEEFPVFRRHPSVYIVEHDINDIDKNKERSYVKNNRVLTLWQFKQGTMVNPCYYGDVKITPKNVTTFVVVGNVEKKRKNHDLLLKAIEKLKGKTSEFHVVVIGRIKDGEEISKDILPFITVTGYLNFPDMYAYMEKADFFLPLLDNKNKDHDRYVTSGVTGSLQLILGFRKIPVIQEKFAKFYGFNSDNAFIYEDDLAAAMLKAVSMTSPQYNRMQEALNKKTLSTFDKSEKNLRRILS